jgi:uncharacterized protein (DUF697 family)
VARLPIKPTVVLSVVKEIKAAAEDFRPVLVAGAAEQGGALREKLASGGDENAVRDLSGRELTRYDLEGAQTLVYVIAGDRPDGGDEAALRLADRSDAEVVCVLVGEPNEEAVDVPYVLATDVVSVAPGDELPIEEIAARIAERAGDKGYVLAAKLPVLRRAVCEDIVRGFSRQNGVLGAAIFIPGADFPVLTLNQIRMVLRIAVAYGAEIDRERALELLPVVAAGFGLRAIARQFVGLVPFAGWAVKGAIAFTGTRALGEAAIAYFERGGARQAARSVRSRS